MERKKSSSSSETSSSLPKASSSTLLERKASSGLMLLRRTTTSSLERVRRRSRKANTCEIGEVMQSCNENKSRREHRRARWKTIAANFKTSSKHEQESVAACAASASSEVATGALNVNVSGASASANGSAPASPPHSKKKGFSGKWLPNIRKLSQGKLDKSSSSSTSTPTTLPPTSESSAMTSAELAPNKNVAINRSLSKNKSSKLVESMGNKSGSEQSETENVSKPSLPEASTSIPLVVEEVKNLSIDQSEPSTTTTATTTTTTTTTSSCGAMESEADVVAKAIEQRSFRLQELLESEKTYVHDLSQCVAYITFMRESKDADEPDVPMPDDLREGKDRMIFGNIEAIYEWHRDFFLKNLEKSVEQPVELGNLFKKYDRKFQMYVVYCQNKPKSEFIVSEHIDTYFEEIRLKLGFKLRLTDLLIKPIQRLTKYHMLLEAILKYSQRAGLDDEADAIQKAFHVMTVVPNQANDMMDIGRLQGFEGKITAQGKLLHRGPLMCVDHFTPSAAAAAGGPATPAGLGGAASGGSGAGPKLRPFTVFLFEQIMIFSETVGRKTQFTSPVYVYKAHFLVNKMALEEHSEDGDPLKFVIRSNDPARDELRIECQAEDAESRAAWIGIMKKQLQTQMDFLKALQAPIAYHSRLAKDSKTRDLSHLWEVVDEASRMHLRQERRLNSHEGDAGWPADAGLRSLPRPSGSFRSASSSRRSLLDGFRHTWRPRTKSEDFRDKKELFAQFRL